MISSHLAERVLLKALWILPFMSFLSLILFFMGYIVEVMGIIYVNALILLLIILNLLLLYLYGHRLSRVAGEPQALRVLIASLIASFTALIIPLILALCDLLFR